MDKKYAKGFSASWIIKKMQIKATMNYQSISIKVNIICLCIQANKYSFCESNPADGYSTSPEKLSGKSASQGEGAHGAPYPWPTVNLGESPEYLDSYNG